MKFKIGDKVLVDSTTIPNLDMGEVQDVDLNDRVYPYWVRIDNKFSSWFTEDELSRMSSILKPEYFNEI